MKYKIVKKTKRVDSTINECYYIMKEVKSRFSKKLKWKYVKHTSNGKHIPSRKSFQYKSEAENYVKDLIEADKTITGIQDVKIYECRDSNIDKLLDETV